MPTYKQFIEDISPERMAQLDAKGKGDAARQKMAADNLKTGSNNTTKPQPTTTKSLPGSKGGELARTSSRSTDKGSAMVKQKQATPSGDNKSGALAKTGEVTPASGGQKPNREPNPYRQSQKQPKKKSNFGSRTAKRLGNTAKGVAGSIYDTAKTPEPKTVQAGDEVGNISGGSQYHSRTKRG